MNAVSKAKLKAKMLEIFREIEKTGEPVIVTDRGRPVLRVIPYLELELPKVVFSDLKPVYHEDILTPVMEEWEEV